MIRSLVFSLIPWTISACAIDPDAADSEAEDAIDASIDDGGKGDAARSGAAYAGAVRAANALSLRELDDVVGLSARTAKAIVAARPLAGITALDAVRYVGPVAIGRLAGYAQDAGWTAVAMIEIPEGPFMMGHPDNFRFEPLHEVRLSRYWIDRTETTNEQWAECIAEGACRAANNGNTAYSALGDHPVTAVQWYEAHAYCAWRGKRLPSEAQWEKAARGTTDLRVHPWGDDAISCDRAFVDACRGSAVQPIAVGSRPLGASVYGVEDMNGNVSEFVSDPYNEFAPVCAEPCLDPEGIAESEADNGYHGVRGASLFSRVGIAGLQIHERWGHWWRTDLGFRCALR
jgi:formylglycine-generating enzyme required for sulfatase activity